ATNDPSAGNGHASLGTEGEDLARLGEIQGRTLRRSQLLKLKAEAELARLEKSPPPEAGKDADTSKPGKVKAQDEPAGKAKSIDPKQVKAGYQKAVELAPRAVEQMERTTKSLQKKDRRAAYPTADEARKILDEIQKAQPRNDQQDQKQQDQDKKNEENKQDQ